MRRSNIESLAEIIYHLLKVQHLEQPLFEKRIINAWPVVLGEQITQYTSRLEIKKSVLYVNINSSVLRQELFFSREEIKNALNKYVGSEVIKEIVFR